MSKIRSRIGKKHAKQAACTISAAALMLGVSEAATVGFNFQAHYCYNAGYSGAVVTAAAFGIGTNEWESLSQMDTGYGCGNPGPFSLNETIDTTTAAGGLNPLPNGSLTVSWSAYESNVSGFGGYQASPPNYKYGGNNFKPGAEEVYWGFLRDGVNFGSGSSGGDNNQPGWSVDITGLKSVFTNSSFVVETIGAGDSISSLTNVFVIDATLSTTQSVIYPNLPPISNVGDTAWPRGIGGGLSTGSGAVNTDHLKIIGNRAQHSAGPPAFNNASQVAGFIITDIPVVTMSPRSQLAGPGDSITLNPYAIGVPPLAYQWRHNGAAVAGATNSSYVIPSLTFALAGNYDLVVTNIYGSATSLVATVTEDSIAMTHGTNFVADSNPSNAPRAGLNYGATWQATNTDGTKIRTGVMQFADVNTNEIVVSGSTNFDASTGTVTFWMRSAGTDQGAPGTTGAPLWGRPASQNGNDFVVAQLDGGNLEFNAPGGGSPANTITSAAMVSDNKWHFVAVTYDQSGSGSASLYVDGVLDAAVANTLPWSSLAGANIELGASSDTSWRAYNGALDDVRVYNRQLTASEVASVYSSGALVDTASLQMQLNFNTAPGVGFNLSWQINNAILQSAASLLGPYTDISGASSSYNVSLPSSGVKFYRYRFTHQVLMTNPYLM